jgi:hypothetical protein
MRAVGNAESAVLRRHAGGEGGGGTAKGKYAGARSGVVELRGNGRCDDEPSYIKTKIITVNGSYRFA